MDVTKVNPRSMPKEEWDKTLFSQKGARGWPYTIFMDADGNVVAEIPLSGLFGKDPEQAVRETLAEAKAFVELRAKARANPDDADTNARYLLLKLKRKRSDEDWKKLEAYAATGKLSKETMEKYKAFKPGYVFGGMWDKFLESYRATGGDAAKGKALEDKLAADTLKMYEDGLAIEDVKDENFPYFWNFTGMGAIAAGKPEIARKALSKLETWLEGYKGNPRAKAFVDRLRQKVEALPKDENGGK